ncbi:hypothetical protein KFE25_005053 [Diacronema lutheri]|uniref:Uncharacterized protein n=1 Tax=Diacronema lutheri TaxID=2081491 RepID=A0A8J6BZW8_DIALT|nr:hypothetical protein KFE25_005053 [Diacronema lutheri]
MPIVYVASWEQPRSAERAVYQLALPRHEPATSTWAWDELAVRESSLHGLGVFPSAAGSLDWSALRLPLLLPYLGAESVVEDAHLHKCLIAVLHGEFSSLTVRELRARHGGAWARNGICAVRLPAAPAPPAAAAAEAALADDVRLLQVSAGESAASASACYLLEADARELLHLQPGARSARRGHGHLFDLLAAHERLEHTDRHLGTHLATIRRDEGYVIVNAHPALCDGLNAVGLINEPSARAKPSLKLVHRSVELLVDGCDELARLGLRQPPCAERVWRDAVLPHDPRCLPGGERAAGDGWRQGERMVVYLAQRRAYGCDDELTVDYGRAYRREYASGERKPHKGFAEARAAAAAAAAAAGADGADGACALLAHLSQGTADTFAPGARDAWPLSLRGWWNPEKQPVSRPAFRQHGDGRVLLLPDLSHVVAARRVLAAARDARAVAGSKAAADGIAHQPQRTRSLPPPPRCHPTSRAAAARVASASHLDRSGAIARACTPLAATPPRVPQRARVAAADEARAAPDESDMVRVAELDALPTPRTVPAALRSPRRVPAERAPAPGRAAPAMPRRKPFFVDLTADEPIDLAASNNSSAGGARHAAPERLCRAEPDCALTQQQQHAPRHRLRARGPSASPPRAHAPRGAEAQVRETAAECGAERPEAHGGTRTLGSFFAVGKRRRLGDGPAAAAGLRGK